MTPAKRGVTAGLNSQWSQCSVPARVRSRAKRSASLAARFRLHGALGAEAERLHWLFVTVDPERDSPEQLAGCLTLFDPRIVGLTGTPAAIADAAKSFSIRYRRVPPEGGGHTMDHSASIFLLDVEGRFGLASGKWRGPDDARGPS